MYTFLWWPILYTNLLLVTYSARTEGFEGYFVHILPHVWPILYKYLFFILICTLVTLVAFYIFFSLRDFTSWPCTYLWWSILYTYVDWVTYSVHMEFFDGFLYTYHPTHFMSLFIYYCLLWPILYIEVKIWSFYMGDIYIRTLLWWPILYTCPLLVTYSVHREHFSTLLFYGLFCIFISPWWAYLYLRNILWQRARLSGDLFCTHTYHEDLYSNDFYGLFHLFLPGVLIFTYFMVIFWWPILYTYCYLGDLFSTYGFLKFNSVLVLPHVLTNIYKYHIFMTYFVTLWFLWPIFLFTFPWWAYLLWLHKYVPLVSYSEHIPSQ